MNDKLSKEELEALQATTGAVSLNSVAYNLHIRTPLARGCFYALNLCALAFLFVSSTGVMEGWLDQVNAPPEEGVTDLKIRSLLVFWLFLCINLAMTFDRFYTNRWYPPSAFISMPSQHGLVSFMSTSRWRMPGHLQYLCCCD